MATIAMTLVMFTTSTSPAVAAPERVVEAARQSVTPSIVVTSPRWTDSALALTFDGPPPTTEPPAPPSTHAPIVDLWPSDRVLYALRMCESTDNYAINTGNGYRGAYQYLQSTWNAAARVAGRPDLVGVPVEHVAPVDQDEVTRAWWNASDYRTQWPVCGPRAIKVA